VTWNNIDNFTRNTASVHKCYAVDDKTWAFFLLPPEPSPFVLSVLLDGGTDRGVNPTCRNMSGVGHEFGPAADRAIGAV